MLKLQAFFNLSHSLKKYLVYGQGSMHVDWCFILVYLQVGQSRSKLKSVINGNNYKTS